MSLNPTFSLTPSNSKFQFSVQNRSMQIQENIPPTPNSTNPIAINPNENDLN